MKIAYILAVLVLAACSSSPPTLKFADGSNRIPINPKPVPRGPSVTDRVPVPEKLADAPATVQEKKAAPSQAAAATPPMAAPHHPAPESTPMQSEAFQVTPPPFAPKAKSKHKCVRSDTTILGSVPVPGSGLAAARFPFKPPG